MQIILKWLLPFILKPYLIVVCFFDENWFYLKPSMWKYESKNLKILLKSHKNCWQVNGEISKHKYYEIYIFMKSPHHIMLT